MSFGSNISIISRITGWLFGKLTVDRPLPFNYRNIKNTRTSRVSEQHPLSSFWSLFKKARTMVVNDKKNPKKYDENSLIKSNLKQVLLFTTYLQVSCGSVLSHSIDALSTPIPGRKSFSPTRHSGHFNCEGVLAVLFVV
ncbi:unnamed protein product [Nesidiocoris tenuis]|uniref:Uncharacterized protein n=1 Tax=Nesidiocoris tenuis TaxID=355587 RepID=A0A6H5HAE3_9HEMI|nr:unnamed protein product [Nesidiocoris tenuis]